MNTIKSAYLLLLSLAAVIFLSSCTEVIEIPLDEADRQVVVQARISNLPGLSQVILTQSGSYYEPGTYPQLSDAFVIIRDEANNSQLLEEIQPGVYSLPGLQAKEGSSYQLEIEHEGITYQAQSAMQALVQIDSVSFEKGQGAPRPGSMPEEGMIMQLHFESNNAAQTYLRFQLLVNDSPQSQLFLYDSSLPRGGIGQYRFFTSPFQSGDRIQIMTEALDQDAFTYFDQLSELTGDAIGPPSAAPANPEGNLSGGALGYFAAVAASVKEVVVP